MTAAREVGLSLPMIAEHFNKDHGSVIHAVRRTAERPRLADAAARIHGHSLPTIARLFERDHTTVLHATRRIEKTPPLRDLAAKIAAELPEEPAGASTRSTDVAEQIPEASYRSPGARGQERAVPVSGEHPQLRVAR